MFERDKMARFEDCLTNNFHSLIWAITGIKFSSREIWFRVIFMWFL